MVSSSAKHSYRRRNKISKCKKLNTATCRKTSRCKYATGKKRSFCRKSRNHKRVKGSTLKRTRSLTRSNTNDGFHSVSSKKSSNSNGFHSVSSK